MVKGLSGPIRKSQSGKVNELVIFLHGYGADGNDLISLSDHFAKLLPNAEFHSPNAPDKCEMGGLGYQWFPIRQNKNGTIDLNARNEIISSVNKINEWIDSLLAEKNIKSSNLLLIGFSQGTMMTLETLVTRQEQFLGVIGFSGGFLQMSNYQMLGNCTKTPILLVHGDADAVVPMSMTDTAVKALGDKGFYVEKYVCSGLGHGISVDGLSQASVFLKKMLFKKKD